jgi:RimJ/RimL family protein N-acetyltransferase/nitroimidazol reductase NimA-like FMN-containing flavoprotein (pyridoxamine 5'-phosphate oxidase superfamily)
MYSPTPRTTGLRLADRLRYDRDLVHAILDAAYHCHLSFVVDGEPRSLPTLHVRLGDTLYVHGSTGSRPLLGARAAARGGSDDDGLAVCVAVTHLDGLVLARSQFHHSANYRSVVAHGVAHLVTDEPLRRTVLAALVDRVAPGRAADSRPPSPRELAQTAVLALPLRDVSAKVRAGGVGDDEADLGLPHWAGVVPLHLAAGLPQPADGVAAPVPEYLRPARPPWLTAPELRGRRVVLEPLDLAHADALFAAADEEVFRHLSTARPTDPAGMAAIVAAALAAWERGERVPFVQRTATGEVVGTTSYHALDPANRSLAIGHTWLGRRWWRTGINREAKLLLLTRAFEELSCERVEWHTDVRNERSQRAIERLGGVREGVLRRHRRRPDGTWRDTVLYAMTADDWPAARDALAGPA